jgi:Ankyrin repeats (many copies)
MLKSPGIAGINFLASEKKDFAQTGVFNQEYTGYTPIMLSVAGGGQNIDCTRMLFESKCDITVKDPVDNNILHIAVLNHNYHALDFLLERWPRDTPIDLSARNK